MPPPFALAIAVTCGFGSQIWSSTSRALWSQTLGDFHQRMGNLAVAGVADEQQPALSLQAVAARDYSQPFSLAVFLVRPTGAIVVACVTLFVWWYHRRDFPAFALCGAAWAVRLRLRIPSGASANRFRTTTFAAADLAAQGRWEQRSWAYF